MTVSIDQFRFGTVDSASVAHLVQPVASGRNDDALFTIVIGIEPFFDDNKRLMNRETDSPCSSRRQSND